MILITQTTLSQWSAMTKRYEHNEVRISIAKKFGFTDIHTTLTTIQKIYEKMGYMLEILINTRRILTIEMFQRIEMRMGTTLTNNIKNCLICA